VNTYKSKDSKAIGGKFYRSNITQTKFVSSDMSTPMGFVYPTSFCTREEIKEVKKQTENSSIDIKFESSLDNLFKSTIKLFVQEADEEDEVNESESAQNSQPLKIKSIGKLDIDFKGRRKKSNTELKKVREPVKEDINMQKLDIVLENIGDFGSESSEKEECKNHLLAMTKTNTQAPNTGNV
jgi:tyrosyl-tRNA synthetase